MGSLFRRSEFVSFPVLAICLFVVIGCTDGDPTDVPTTGNANNGHSTPRPRQSHADDVRVMKLVDRSRSAATTNEGRDQLFNEALDLLQHDGLTNRVIDMVTLIADNLYRHDEPHFADALDRIGASIRKRNAKRFAFKASRLEGIARRLRSPGKAFELTGTTLDGKPLDWKAYQGKVVLVDYWETRCVPCIEEFNNIRKNYARFHDRGFELVSISMDIDRDEVRQFIQKHKIPGTTLFDSRGYGQPMALKYGVTTVPTVFLVGRDGKVVSRSIHGPKLERLLLQLLTDH